MTMHEDESDMDPAIAPSVAQQIDVSLRRLYESAASEELPKGLQDLLMALRQQDREGPRGDA
ncbi:MAG: NepR family anti-sigma factor [Roseinatronobacter sp.]